MGRPRRHPPHSKIVDASGDIINRWRWETPPEWTCWACGSYDGKSKPTRAHIHPVKSGGSDDPSNFFLLCDYCHEGQPDGAPRDMQIDWLMSVEYCLVRQWQQTIDMFDRLRSIDGADSLNAWLSECGERAREDAVRAVLESTCGPRGVSGVFEQSMRFNYLDWLKSRQKEVA